MYLELHMLQNFAPSNLNRDDTNSPKDCEFGGYRRARISSQSLKRAIRSDFDNSGLVDGAHLSKRTKRLREELSRRFQASGKSEEDAGTVAANAITGIGLKFDRNGDKTQYLLFLGAEEINRITELCLENWELMLEDKGGRDRTAINKELKQLLDGGKASDLALFGRMLADLPDRNVDAASQVAHAISTNRINLEFDFYTAVDDLRPEDTEGADMLGTVEFNSACFYRYANIDCNQLLENLGGDEELTQSTIEAFLRASAQAIPTGKQNSMAAHNPPSLIFAVLRDGERWSLANAFIRPIAPNHEGDLIGRSVEALDTYWGQLTTMYGDRDINGAWVCTLDGNGLKTLEPARVDSFEALVDGVLGATGFAANGS